MHISSNGGYLGMFSLYESCLCDLERAGSRLKELQGFILLEVGVLIHERELLSANLSF